MNEIDTRNPIGCSSQIKCSRNWWFFPTTRKNNQEPIDAYLADNPLPANTTLKFAYFDLPYWMRFWKKGGRGAMLYYLMWQKGIVGFIKKQNIEFDITHNLNFHNDWSPSYIWKLDKPFVWGPVGHHPEIPIYYALLYQHQHSNENLQIIWSENLGLL